MDTRSEIINIADALIRAKGYNAFSFTDIGKQLNIKNASIHYHFPTKTDLGVAIIAQHQKQLSVYVRQVYVCSMFILPVSLYLRVFSFNILFVSTVHLCVCLHV